MKPVEGSVKVRVPEPRRILAGLGAPPPPETPPSVWFLPFRSRTVLLRNPIDVVIGKRSSPASWRVPAASIVPPVYVLDPDRIRVLDPLFSKALKGAPAPLMLPA